MDDKHYLSSTKKKNQIVTIRNKNGTLAYIGKVKNGLPHGKGRAFFGWNQLIYDGSFKYGKLNGVGTEYRDGLITYRGNFDNGLYHKQGALYDGYGRLYYSGTFCKGLKQGVGLLYTKKGYINAIVDHVKGKMMQYASFQLTFN